MPTAVVPKPAAPPTLSHNLPTSLMPFVGREALLGEIKTRLCHPDCRLLTLLGPGGSGKTRLALETARRLIADSERECYADGLYFVPLAAVMDIESVVPAIAQAVGFSFYGDGEPQTQLLNYLRRRNLLLILDNFEHLARDAGLTDEMLRTAPGIEILVTSRVRLNLRPEQRIPVVGMDYPATSEDPSTVLSSCLCSVRGVCSRTLCWTLVMQVMWCVYANLYMGCHLEYCWQRHGSIC